MCALTKEEVVLRGVSVSKARCLVLVIHRTRAAAGLVGVVVVTGPVVLGSCTAGHVSELAAAGGVRTQG